jgi:hypothetical protein
MTSVVMHMALNSLGIEGLKEDIPANLLKNNLRLTTYQSALINHFIICIWSFFFIFAISSPTLLITAVDNSYSILTYRLCSVGVRILWDIPRPRAMTGTLGVLPPGGLMLPS